MAKNSILALDDMFRSLGSAMDAEVSAIAKVLIKVFSTNYILLSVNFNVV